MVCLLTHVFNSLLQQIAVPRPDEWTRFLKTLSELGENQEEAEDLATQRLAA